MRKTNVAFVDNNLKRAFDKLENTSEKWLVKFILRAVDDLKKQPTFGTHIPKKLIPKKYIKKFKVNNLWKYDLPKGWRLIYTIKGDGIKIVAILLEWMSHKDYDRLFGYNTT